MPDLNLNVTSGGRQIAGKLFKSPIDPPLVEHVFFEKITGDVLFSAYGRCAVARYFS